METGCSGTQMSRAGYIVAGVTLTCTMANNKTLKQIEINFKKRENIRNHKDESIIKTSHRSLLVDVTAVVFSALWFLFCRHYFFLIC